MRILTYPDSFLRTVAKPVENIDEEIVKIIEEMTLLMIEKNGNGLAAVQVGLDMQIFTYYRGGSRPDVLINPKIISSEDLTISSGEGCLSIPGITSNLNRFYKLFVNGLDINGKEVKIETFGLDSIIIQHEVDHLNGILFIDHFSSLKRKMYEKKIKKKLKRNT